MSNEGRPLMTDHRRHLRPPRHLGGACSRSPTRCATGTTPSTSTPASRTSCSRARRHGLGKRDLRRNINWFMNVPVEADGTPRHRRRHLRAGQVRRAARRDGLLVRGLELPADQQPVQRLRPDAGPHDRDPSARDGAADPRHRRPRRQPRRDRRAASSRTLRRLRHRSVAVFSDADRGAAHVRLADEAVRARAGPAAAESYLRADRIVEAALRHRRRRGPPRLRVPVRERRRSPRPSRRAGLAFVGPDARADRAVRRQAPRPRARRGRRRAAAARHRAARRPRRGRRRGRRRSATRCCSRRPRAAAASACAAAPTRRAARRLRAASRAWPQAQLRRPAACSSSGFVPAARHVEVQVVRRRRAARVLALGDRDCSLQRRNQKVVEEAPAPDLARRVRAGAARGARARWRASVDYRSAGHRRVRRRRRARASSTFLEVNTRLQVEHGSPRWCSASTSSSGCCASAAGDAADARRRRARGRAATPSRPASTPRTRPATSARARACSPTCAFPAACGSTRGSRPAPRSPPHYDPLLAKVIVDGDDRDAARRRARRRPAPTPGSPASRPTSTAARPCCADPRRSRPRHHDTRTLDARSSAPTASRCCAPGHAHDRAGLARPPRLLGRRRAAVAARWTTARSASATARRQPRGRAPASSARCRPDAALPPAATVVCLAGAAMGATLDGAPVPHWAPVAVPRRARRSPRRRRPGPGCAPTCWCAGGIDVPELPRQPRDVHARRVRRPRRPGRCAPGDVLAPRRRRRGGGAGRRRRPTSAPALARPRGRSACSTARTPRPTSSRPTTSTTLLRRRLEGALQLGPHRRAPRRPEARVGPPDGGEAGLHPSNIHDNAYAVGAVDFTGDMPIILGPDGPSLGGFVCPATVVAGELWKLGQLAAGRPVRFVPSRGEADAAADAARRRRRGRRRRRATAGGRRRRRPRSPTGRSRRPLPARRVRRQVARPRPAVPRPRADASALAAAAARRHRRPHARASARCRSTSTPTALTVARAARASSRELERRPAAPTTLRGPSRDRPPAAVVGRPGHPRGHRALHAGRARRRAVVPEQHRVHPPHQRPRPTSTTCTASCSTPLPGARARRRLPRRAGGDPARPAPPPGHDEVQPGPHLDARERGRHRRRLPVHLRHGGPRRLPVRRPHRAGVEPRTGRSARPRAERPWLLRFFDQIRFYPVGADELLDLRRRQVAGRARSDVDDDRVRRRRAPPVPGWPPTTTTIAAFRAAPAGRRSPPSGSAGRPAASCAGPSELAEAGDDGAGAAPATPRRRPARRGALVVGARSPPRSATSSVAAGDGGRGGRPARRARGDEDGGGRAAPTVAGRSRGWAAVRASS